MKQVDENDIAFLLKVCKQQRENLFHAVEKKDRDFIDGLYAENETIHRLYWEIYHLKWFAQYWDKLQEVQKKKDSEEEKNSLLKRFADSFKSIYPELDVMYPQLVPQIFKYKKQYIEEIERMIRFDKTTEEKLNTFHANFLEYIAYMQSEIAKLKCNNSKEK